MRRRVLQWLNKSITVDFDGELLCFTAEENCQFSFTNGIYYSTDQEKWELLPKNTYTPVISRGEKIWWYANLIPNPNANANGIGTFSSTGRFNAGGNPRCLLVDNKLVGHAYYKLFYYSSNLTNASNLILDDDVLTQSCYGYMFYGCTSLTQAPELPATTLASHCYYVMFNNCSSLTEAPELPATTLANYCYYSMFTGCMSLTEAPELPATTLTNHCYAGMFQSCTSLTQAPELPATTLAERCYWAMFWSCSSLTTAPELPATTLTTECYRLMFQNCRSLNYVKSHATTDVNTANLYTWLSGVSDAGEFHKPAGVTYPTGASGIPSGWTRHNIEYLTFEVVSDSSFKFRNTVQYSTDQITWNTLSANTNTSIFSPGSKVYWKGNLSPFIYDGIGTFSSTGQFNVSGNPKELLKDKKLEWYSFCKLFMNCVNLVDASGLILDYTTLINYCYDSMFYNCKNLTKAPKLPATTLANNCYRSMFYNCTSLTEAPELPATTLANNCYEYMFSGCTSLTSAPELPATTLTDFCYDYMFQGCSKLNYVKSYATDISASYCLFNWLSGVSSTGNFYKPSDIDYPEGFSGIPKDWKVVSLLQITSLEDGEISFKQKATGSVRYSKDLINWEELVSETPIEVAANDIIYFEGTLNTKGSSIGQFSSNCKFNLAGDPLCLINNNKLDKWCFSDLFADTEVVDASKLELPSEDISELPYCYAYMFDGCSELVGAPELPAHYLSEGCYCFMFQNCSKLTTAPELPATVLVDSCYTNMFNGCNKLNYVKSYATNISANGCLISWLDRVSDTGDFYKPKGMNYPEGISGIPSNWTKCDMEYLMFEVIDDNGSSFKFTNTAQYSTDQIAWATLSANNNTSTFPVGTKVYWKGELTPTTTAGVGAFSSTGQFNVSGDPKWLLKDNKLVDYSFYKLFMNCTNLVEASGLTIFEEGDSAKYKCCGYMFYGCTSLTTAPELPAMKLADYCYQHMFNGCSKLTTAPELPAAILTMRCYEYMFRYCTSLITAPELPATTLASNCYSGMFDGCSKLNKVICHATTNINETNLSNWLTGVFSTGDFYSAEGVSYLNGASGIPTNWTRHDISPLRFTAIEEGQFSFTNDIQYKIDEGEWTDLKANELTNTVPANSTIYWKGELEPNYLNGVGTFSSINKFKVLGNPIQILKDWKLVDYAFSSLFYGCDKLIDASELILDMETLTPYCYSSMFMNCASLEKTSELPAITLGIGCYSNMFNGCSSLTTAPELPATTLTNYCYNGMFFGCSKLNYVKSYTTDISAPDCLYNWLDGVAIDGYFYKMEDVNYIEGSSGIPSGWVVEIMKKPDLGSTDMEFFFITNKDSIISFSNDVEYSLNDGIWNNYTANTELNIPINTAIGFRGNLTPDTTDTSLGIGTFSITGDVSVYGDPKALLVDNTLVNYAFSKLFNNCEGLTDASGLILDSPELKPGCYQHMFAGCSSLHKAPIELPATVAVNYCYYYMFNGCKSLTTAPEILLNDKGTGGKYSILGSSAPCDDPMSYMFTNCHALNSIKCHMPALSFKLSLFTAAIATNWVDGVSKTGTFYKKADASIATGVSGIPSGWEVIEIEK